ncbi:DUF6527 family protein [Bradyrhizobium sp. Tv2a-2]|uniref:DUF6527 family protein n=1 Tax=Bradyrhizobium sp. Tv2a-2 TaxID=113395 RepID=UPI0003F7A9E4|nr:DUF6527 family protein [Bradyrhizobium sp. Tv2a-2]
MGTLSKKLRSASGADGSRSLVHWCPGCEEVHRIPIAAPSGPLWRFNGNHDSPTFEPSVLLFVTETEDDDEMPLPAPRQTTLCHYFIRNGRIEFCGDSPHKLSGQTVDLPDWPYQEGAYGGIDGA